MADGGWRMPDAGWRMADGDETPPLKVVEGDAERREDVFPRRTVGIRHAGLSRP